SSAHFPLLLGAEHGFVEPQPVAVRDLVRLGGVESRLPQALRDRPELAHVLEPVGRRYGAGPRSRSRAVVDAARPASLAHPVAVLVGMAMAAIGADGDVVDARDLHRLRHHLAPPLERAAEIVARDVAVRRAADDAAIVAQRA